MIQEENPIFLEVIVLVVMRKDVHMIVCLILNGYQDRAVRNSRPNSVRFLFVGLDDELSLQKEGG